MKTRKHKKPIWKMTSTSLPDDIAEEILMRLYSSVKSLLRFKCVSKSWCSLISSKRFVKTHLQKSSQSTPPSDYKAIMMSLLEKSNRKTNVIVNHCPVSSLFSEQSINIVRFNLGHDKLHNEANKIMVGYSNGLCCLLLGEVSFILLNPSTRKSYKLPSVFENLTKFKRVFTAGFGYDECNDEYKVLAVLRKRYRNYIVRLYSLKTNSWKTLNNCSGYNVLTEVNTDEFGFGGNGVLVNGRLHWAKESNKSPYVKIVSFDLASEVVETIKPPNSAERCWRIGVLDGCLAVFHWDYWDYGSTPVWVMKEYNVKESWCRLMTIPALVQVHYDKSCKPSYPVCISNGEVFVIHHYCNFIYNPQTKSNRPLDKINKFQGNIGDIVLSVQSLEPFPDG